MNIRKEIRKQIDDYAEAYHGDFPMPDETVETIFYIFTQRFESIIGKDEKELPDALDLKHINQFEFVKPFIRNKLRSEQREVLKRLK